MQADFVKLRKRFKALAGSKEALEKQSKALQELHAKQRLEMDGLRDDASSQVSHMHNQSPFQLWTWFCHCERVPVQE